MQRARLPYLLIPLAALLAILPLLIHGCSCGHDFDFHLLSWMEAARQFTHGNLHPHWAYTPAYNAGEPRFIFYPPISWTIGAILGLILPWTWTPILYTWLALTAAGLSLHYLARDFAPPNAVLLAAILYTTNPYMLFTAYERTAYAELLAAAWIPLLLHAILRQQITIPRIAIPIALLWLTNAPAAVMSCYALALLTFIRLLESSIKVKALHRSSSVPPKAVISTEASHGLIVSRAVEKPASLSPLPTTSSPINTPTQTALRIAVNTISGTALGLGLAAFYILPAAYERRFVQIAMAIIPFYRIQDNFLFHHTADAPHDQVLHTASLIAAILIAATVVVLATLRLTNKARVRHPSRSHREGWDEQRSTSRASLISLTTLTIAITLLLTPITKIIWNHAPELAFLQFPWRLLAILAVVLCLAVALAIKPLKIKSATTTILAITIAAALTYPAYANFHQTCDPEDTVQTRLALFHSNQGTDPTDEYTPTTADNDSLALANPSYWLSSDPTAKAPANAHPSPAPTHLTLNSPAPANIILNLRDYPGWRILLNGAPIAARIQRADGLIALPIPAGPATIDITYAHTLDQTLGDIISLTSLGLIFFVILRKPRIA